MKHYIKVTDMYNSENYAIIDDKCLKVLDWIKPKEEEQCNSCIYGKYEILNELPANIDINSIDDFTSTSEKIIHAFILNKKSLEPDVKSAKISTTQFDFLYWLIDENDFINTQIFWLGIMDEPIDLR